MIRPSSRRFLIFLVRFFGVFLFLYYGSLMIVGLSAPGGYYSEFISRYFNFVSLLQISLILGAHQILAILCYDTEWNYQFYLYSGHGHAVIVSYGCAGLGVMSFWIAYTLAVTGSFLRKFLWMVSGLLLIWVINVFRIAMVFMALEDGWSLPFGMDHHTLFNVTAYTVIFMLIFLFERKNRLPDPAIQKLS